MRVFIVGGTGFLGSKAAEILLERGHEVSAIALPAIPEGAVLPPQMSLELADYFEMSDERLLNAMRGCDGFVFAAGIDERIDGEAPILELYRKYNVESLKRLLRIAKEAGVRHAAVCSSYYAYFDRIWPEKELSKWHPYIKSRREQEEAALSFAAEDFDVAILEFPSIFGALKGRKPTWFYMIDSITNMKDETVYPKGGTSVITLKQAGQAIAGALERNRGGNCYPIGYYNMQWTELLKIIHKYLGCPEKKIRTIPKWVYTAGGRRLMKVQRRNNRESGLHMVKFTELQCADKYVDPALGSEILGVEPDDYDQAVGETVKQCRRILSRKEKAISMQYE